MDIRTAVEGLEVAKQILMGDQATLTKDQIALAQQILGGISSGDENGVKEKTVSAAARSALRTKHTLTGALAPQAEHRPFSELAFFQDCALEAGIINTIVQPMASILNMIPARPTLTENKKQAYLTRNTVDTRAGQTPPATDCDDCEELDHLISLCKIDTLLSKLCRSTRTLETNKLIRQACDRLYDDFFFMGELTGIQMSYPWINSIEGRNFFVESAVRKQLWNIGRFFQQKMMKEIWTGTGARAPSTAQQCLGLLNQIRCDYHTNGPATQGMNIECVDYYQPGTVGAPPASGANGWLRRLNSDCKDHNNTCVQSPDATTQTTLFEKLQAMEHFLYQRALQTGALPVSWAIFMRSEMWSEVTKYFPCQAAFNGCGNMSLGPTNAGQTVVSPQVTIDATAQVAMRQQMLNSGQMSLNGRNYTVFTDDALPFTDVQVTVNGVQRQGRSSTILMVPFFAYGEETLWIEHMDYSAVDAALAPIPGSQTDLLGWTDGGRFHHVIRQKNWCFQIQSKMEKRLHFTTPHLAGRIDNVVACPLQIPDTPWEMYDATGNRVPTNILGS